MHTSTSVHHAEDEVIQPAIVRHLEDVNCATFEFQGCTFFLKTNEQIQATRNALAVAIKRLEEIHLTR